MTPVTASADRSAPTAGACTLPACYPLAPWAGFAVLCGYAVPAMGLAVFVFRRRDA